MVASSTVRTLDPYGHSRDIESCYGNGFTVATSGTAKGTLVYPQTADPAGTANITEPYGAGDGGGLVLITTSGTQTTGQLMVVNFRTPYAYVPSGVSVTISALSNGAAAGGTITTTVTATGITISVGTALTTATQYLVRYTVAG